MKASRSGSPGGGEATVICDACGSETGVAETRGNRRRRECTRCGDRFTTYEVRAEDLRRLEAAERKLAALSEILRAPAAQDDGPTQPADLDVTLP